MKQVFFVLLIAFITHSCQREYTCNTGGLSIGFTTLNPNENDTIFVRAFEKGSNFQTAIQSFTYVFPQDQDSINGITQNGTTLLLNGFEYLVNDPNSNGGFLVADNDFEVQLRQNMYRITNMQIETRKEKKNLFKKKKVCFSPVYQFDLNQVTISIDPFSVYILE